MDENSTIQTAAAEPEQPQMSFFGRLNGMIFEPGKTFADLNRRPTWLGMYILMTILVMCSSYALMSRMDPEMMMRKSLQMNPMTRNMSEEQVQKIASAPRSPIQRYLGMVFAPIGILIQYFILAGIFLLVFLLLGASIPYKKALSVSYWGMAPPALVLILLSILFMYIKDPATLELNPAGNVASNLGAFGLVDSKAHPALNSLLSSIDVFSIWTIALLSIGFAAVSDRKLTTKKAAIAVIALWAVWVLGKAGISSLFG